MTNWLRQQKISGEDHLLSGHVLTSGLKRSRVCGEQRGWTGWELSAAVVLLQPA